MVQPHYDVHRPRTQLKIYSGRFAAGAGRPNSYLVVPESEAPNNGLSEYKRHGAFAVELGIYMYVFSSE